MLSLIFLTQAAFIALVFGSSLISCSVFLSFVRKYGIVSAMHTVYSELRQLYFEHRVLLYPLRTIRKRVDTLLFLFDAPRIIRREYDASSGGSFTVDAPDIHYHMVSDKVLIRELDRAPRDVLSLQGAAKLLLQPQYSMHKFDWFEQRGKDGTPLVRTLRSLLRHDLPLLLPETRKINSEILHRMLSLSGKPVPVSHIVRACVVHMNARAIFGKDLAANKEFMVAAEGFVDQTIFISESARLLPGILGRCVASLLGLYFSAQHKIFHAIRLVAQERIDEQELRRSEKTDVPVHRDCLQWVMEQSSRFRPWTCELTKPWGADRIAHELMAVWFGAVHTMVMATVFAVRDIAMHPEYVDTLRSEIEGPAYVAWEQTGNGMPLLDSFLKESARLSPIENVSTRRKALKPFELSNGLRVQEGDWLATPLDSMNTDAKNWINPLIFHGFRHIDSATMASLNEKTSFTYPEPEKAAPLTDARGWQTWGTGRMACPGRFYAVAGIKQIVSLILMKYDCEIEDRSRPYKFSWRTCNVPREDMPIVLRPTNYVNNAGGT